MTTPNYEHGTTSLCHQLIVLLNIYARNKLSRFTTKMVLLPQRFPRTWLPRLRLLRRRPLCTPVGDRYEFECCRFLAGRTLLIYPVDTKLLADPQPKYRRISSSIFPMNRCDWPPHRHDQPFLQILMFLPYPGEFGIVKMRGEVRLAAYRASRIWLSWNLYQERQE